jgi:AraC family transcriptional regulator
VGASCHAKQLGDSGGLQHGRTVSRLPHAVAHEKPRGAQSAAAMPSVDTTTFTRPPGLCDALPRADHGLSLHLGAPVDTLCLDVPGTRRFQRVPGGINIVPAGARSRWLIEGAMDAMYIRIPAFKLLAVAQDMGLERTGVSLQERRQVHDQRIEWIAKALHIERTEGLLHGTLLADSLEHALCSRLLVAHATRLALPPSARGRFNGEGLQRLLRHVDDHLDDPGLTLDHLAQVAGTSVSFLKDAFRGAMGIPLHRYVVRRRVERAAQLLGQGGDISDVATAVGFSHATHLARWTRRLLNATPQQLQPAGRSRAVVRGSRR